jgi:hypothetical protein
MRCGYLKEAITILVKYMKLWTFSSTGWDRWALEEDIKSCLQLLVNERKGEQTT